MPGSMLTPMNDVDLLALYNAERTSERLNLPRGVMAEEDGPVWRILYPSRGFVSTPPHIRLEDSELDLLIARQRDSFAARGEAVEWKTRATDLPAGLPERLIAAGFVAEERETVMIGRADHLADRPLPTDVEIRLATDRADLDAIAAMETEVWGDDWSWLADDLEARLESGGAAVTIFVAEARADDGADARVVSAGWLVLRDGATIGSLWGGSTLPQWRGRGIYRALVGERARVAREVGIRYLQVDASGASRPILERLGFVAITTTTPYVWSPTG